MNLACRAFSMAVVALLASTALAACGPPSAQTLTTGDSVEFAAPAEWDGVDDFGPDVVAVGHPIDTDLGVRTEPVVIVQSLAGSTADSFETLRRRTMGYDPLNPDDDLVTEITMLGYDEFTEPRAWGVEMYFSNSNSLYRVLTLVNRADMSVHIATVTCTRRCFERNLDTIEQIMSSWTIEEPR